MSKSSSIQVGKTTTANADPVRSAALQRHHTLGVHHAIQRDAIGLGVQPHAPNLVHGVLNSPGQPLDSSTRSFMEPRFGHDFSNVRVHADERAAESARAVNASAYTAGAHLVFGSNQYSPGTSTGQRLMAHELTHVVQQASGPVSGSAVAQGLSVSHHGDPDEKAARTTAEQVTDIHSTYNPKPAALPARSISGAGNICVQRADPATSLGITTGTADTAPEGNVAAAKSALAAEKSANAGVASAVFGGFSALGALVSAFEAIKQANFAERSAQAAEDPPIQEPTSGGVTSNHTDIQEVKGVDLNPEPETTTEEEDVISFEGLSGVKDKIKIPDEEKTDITKGSHTKKLTTKKVSKAKGDVDKEKSFTLLRLQQAGKEGKEENSAEFRLTLRYNDKDVRGGMTEDAEIKGYFGGTNHSNAAVTFKSTPGGHLKDGTATTRLLFGGSNVPPRKTITPSGFFGGGGAKETKDYTVQRFGLSARFSAKGEFLEFGKINVTPQDRSIASFATPKDANADEDKPLVSISLADKGGTAGNLTWTEFQKQEKERRKGFKEGQMAK